MSNFRYTTYKWKNCLFVRFKTSHGRDLITPMGQKHYPFYFALRSSLTKPKKQSKKEEYVIYMDPGGFIQGTSYLNIQNFHLTIWYLF